jgi:hypothetical protein
MLIQFLDGTVELAAETSTLPARIVISGLQGAPGEDGENGAPGETGATGPAGAGAFFYNKTPADSDPSDVVPETDPLFVNVSGGDLILTDVFIKNGATAIAAHASDGVAWTVRVHNETHTAYEESDVDSVATGGFAAYAMLSMVSEGSESLPITIPAGGTVTFLSTKLGAGKISGKYTVALTVDAAP